MNDSRGFRLIAFGLFLILIIWIVSGMFKHKPTVYSSSNTSRTSTVSNSGSENASVGTSSAATANVAPWDYKIEERTVGDRINGDMTLLPDNQLLPNDENYASGDKVWVLDSMDAVTTPRPDGSDDIRLTSWKPVKSYKTEAQAKDDVAKLKEQVQTDVDLVGVYKTELDGKFREFAVIRMPSGSEVKQPIDEAHYNDFKSKKQVKVQLEIVHALSDYDLAMPKFRGWSS